MKEDYRCRVERQSFHATGAHKGWWSGLVDGREGKASCCRAMLFKKGCVAGWIKSTAYRMMPAGWISKSPHGKKKAPKKHFFCDVGFSMETNTALPVALFSFIVRSKKRAMKEKGATGVHKGWWSGLVVA